MNEPIKKYFKIGTIHFMSFPEVIGGEGPIEETLKIILEDDYFDAVEITWVKDPEVRKRVAKMLKDAHIAVAYGAQPTLLRTGQNPNDLDPEKRKQVINFLKERIDEAIELGAQGLGFLSRQYDEAKKEEAFEALVDTTLQLCDYAKSKGNFLIELEVFDFDIDKKSLIGPAELAAKFAERIKKEYDNFGLIVDLSHLPLTRETAEQALLPVKDYLTHVHIGNAVVKDPSHPAYGDKHPMFGIEGGENDVEEVIEFLRVLKEIGFMDPTKRPILSFEVTPMAGQDPKIVLASSKRVLNEAWARL
ncbi:Xylose isomerase domain-containing protein TIM barrel [Caldicellulosiruptor kronotskyensis 2002]|uniref:Xylose isomerase domain-containing protein TIM barrel n=1 Tax=Caldicellulosiruptor kronotskyensis (strain DSM 18902 / VKM B-2412 / 2002) TaxID=632348 RepID=E4SCS6_CALK2|nr:sugar phosphate isomerase/epimerase [Caldicellulosiruptor kronotskyensis]ADQ45059.1 Xylose isomerase domain-containing protein TIM barrel [Caldicellulosiruptor kronotskyensis 2002]